jgi:hypothetical protein
MAGTSNVGSGNGQVATGSACPIAIPAVPAYLSNFTSWVYLFAAIGIVWAVVIHFRK